MKTSLILGFILILSVIPLMTAAIHSDESEINIHLIKTEFQSNGSIDKITLRVAFNTSDYPDLNDVAFSDFTIEFPVSDGDRVWTSPEIRYIVESNTTAENIDFAQEYFQCLSEKSSLNQGYNTCVLARDRCLNEVGGENLTTCGRDLDDCNLLVKEKNLQITAKDNEIADLTNEKESTKNSKWIYAVIGIIIGGAGFYFYNNSKRGGQVRDKFVDEWPRSQAG